MTSSPAGRPGASREPASPPGKPRELEDSLNFYIFHPLSRRLARALQTTFVTPNMVSVFGGLLVAAAAFFYTELDWPVSLLLGFTSHALWHVVDGADGDLARLTGKASPLGELVDGVCDYAGHVLLYIVLAAFLDDHIGWWAWPLVAVSGASRVAQANHAESQRRIYLWRVYGVPWLQQAQASDDVLFKKRSLFARIFTPMARGYIALAAALSPSSPAIDAAIAQGEDDPARRDRLRGLCKQVSRRPLFLQMLLGANLRTVLLGGSMALGSPLYFFLTESTIFNLLLFLSIKEQKSANVALTRAVAVDA